MRGAECAGGRVDPGRHRAWPPFPGFDVAFGAKWPSPIRSYSLDAGLLSEASRKADKFDRAFAVTNLYMEPLDRLSKLDVRPALAVCVVPDEVSENCRPKSSVAFAERSDAARTKVEVKFLKRAIEDRDSGQSRMFDDEDPLVTTALEEMDEFEEARGLSPDFRRQLKARMMAHELPVQIIKESTLRMPPQVRNGEPGTNPLSDRLWNFGTAVFYKCGAKPWKTPWAGKAFVMSGSPTSLPRTVETHAALLRCSSTAATVSSSSASLARGTPTSAASSTYRPTRPKRCYVEPSRPTSRKTGVH